MRLQIESWEDIRVALEEMSPRSRLFKMVKSEVSKRGYWRHRPLRKQKPQG